MKTNSVIKNIAFFGDSDVKEGSQEYQNAFNTARFLAEKGFAIVNGGGPGVMDAATKGAESVGGDTLVVTFYPEDAPGFEGRYLKNVADKEIKTENYIERMYTLLEHGDIFVVFKGGSGTMSEFATAWVLAKLYYGHHKPFILFGNFWKEIVESIKKNMNIDEKELDVFKIVNTKEQVLELIQEINKRSEK